MSKIMPPQSFSPEANEALYSKLKDLAEPHVERSGGELSILPNKLDKYPAQALGVFCVNGEIAKPEGIDFIGTRKMPRFVEMYTNFMDSDRGGQTLHEEIEGLLRDEQSIVVATDHDDVTSPAYPLAGVANPLRRANERRAEAERVRFETGIIVGKMLSVLAYDVEGQWVPCMQVLQMMCDRVYLSYPRSKTFLDSGAADTMPPGHIGEHNDKLKVDIDTWMARGAAILGESLLGSTHDRQQDGRVQELPRVTEGTARMVTYDHIHLLPMIVGLTEADPYMEAIGPIQQLETWEDVHPFSENMAATRTARSRDEGSDITYVYQTPEQAEWQRQVQAR
jgi:hypothetical protein